MLIQEVDYEGHHQQVHIDHLLPAPRPTIFRSQEIVVSNTQPEVWDNAGPLDMPKSWVQQMIIYRHLVLLY